MQGGVHFYRKDTIKLNVQKKPAVLAYSCMLLLGAVVNIINSTLVPLTAIYATDISRVSFLISCLGIGRIITQLFCGQLADRYGRKVISLSGLAMVLVFFFLMPMLKSFPAAITLSIIGGMGFGMVNTSMLALIFDCFAPSGRNTTAQNYVQLLFSLGGVITPFVANRLLANGLYWGFLYWGCAAYSLILLAVTICIRFPQQFVRDSNTADFAVKPRLMRDGLLLCSVIFFIYGAAIICMTWIATFAVDKLDIDDTASVLILATYNVGSVIGTIFFAQLVKRVHGSVLLITNSAIAFVSLSICVYANSAPLFIAAVFVSGFVIAVTFNLGIGIGGELFSNNAATISAMISITSAINTLLIPVITGYILRQAGVRIAFSVAIVLSGMAIVAAILMRRRYSVLKGTVVANR